MVTFRKNMNFLPRSSTEWTKGMWGIWRTDKYHKTEHFCCWNVFNDMCTIGWWSFWSWFDVNRSIFDEAMHDKQFFTFSLAVTLTFDLW